MEWYNIWGGAFRQHNLTEALDASETAIDVDSATGITANDLILIDNELIKVGTISSNTLGTGGGPSTRGSNGTTAATHADNTLVRLAVVTQTLLMILLVGQCSICYSSGCAN